VKVIANPNLLASENSAADDSTMEVIAKPNVATKDGASKFNVGMEDTTSKLTVADTAAVEPTLLETSIAAGSTVVAGNEQCDNSNSSGASLQQQAIDNVLMSTVML
jgi:hypothetical protein